MAEVKEHPFFEGIDWDALGRKQYEINTDLNSRPPIDVNIFESNFDTEYTSLPISIKPEDEELVQASENSKVELNPPKRRCNSMITRH